MIKKRSAFLVHLSGLSMLPFLLAPVSYAGASSPACDPHTYGAKEDGVTKDTVALQKAIDVCAERGGGTVSFGPGVYLSGPLVLKSNITLELRKGATLLGSPDFRDYPAKTEFRAPGLQSLVSATDASNVAIIGEGVVDGNGEGWWKMARAMKDAGVMGSDHPRPRLVVFDHCRHVRVQGVTLQNSPMWQLVPYYSDDVMIDNIRVLAPAHSPNTDAIDPFSASHVRISHVYADVGDDNIAIKSGEANSPGPDSPSHDITITDCIFLHGHGLSIRSEIAGGAQNIRAERIQFQGTDNGIRVKANRDRGNDVGNLLLRDIQMRGVKNALIISEYYPKVLPPDPDTPGPMTRLTPHFHDITVENMTAVQSISAGAIAGLPESPVLNVFLHNVKMQAQKGLIISHAQVKCVGLTVDASEGPSVRKLDGANLLMR